MRRSLLVLFVVGCGGIDISEFQDETVDARCEYLARCGLFPTANACRDYYADRTVQSTSVVAAVDAGKVKYDEDLAEECLDDLRDASCSQTAGLDSSCEDIFTGTIADGGMCAFDAECVSRRCSVTDCAEACCPGTCMPARPTPKIGEMCTFVCVDGAYCGSDSICHAVLAKGAACDDPFACGDGLYCSGLTVMMAGTCTALPKTGEACTEQCLEIGDYCDGTCKKVGLDGAVCTSDEQCSRYYPCDDTGHCALPASEMGLPNGSTCSSSPQCESHYCGNDNKCADLPVCI
jgi:hypothetical protein